MTDCMDVDEIRRDAKNLLLQAKKLMKNNRFERAFSMLEMRRNLINAAFAENETSAELKAWKDSIGDEEACASLLFGQISERTGKVSAAKIYYLAALRIQQEEFQKYYLIGEESPQLIETALKKVACLYIIIRHCMLENNFSSALTLHGAIDSVEAMKNRTTQKEVWESKESVLSQDIAYSQGQTLRFFNSALKAQLTKGQNVPSSESTNEETNIEYLEDEGKQDILLQGDLSQFSNDNKDSLILHPTSTPSMYTTIKPYFSRWICACV